MDEHMGEDDKDVEEAIRKSLDRLDNPYEIAQGDEVSKNEETDDEALVGADSTEEIDIITEITKNVLKMMNFEGEVWVKKEDEEYQTNISTEELNGLLIGKNGETLLALQHIVRRIAQRRIPEAKLTIDIGNYRRRRNDRIVKMAKELAESAKEKVKDESIKFLNPYERWLIHSALESDPDVVTHTEGEGTHKTLVITPVKK